MKRILLISRKGKERDALTQLLEAEGTPELENDGSFNKVETAGTEEEAYAQLKQTEYELVIINSPIDGKSGADLAVFIAENYISGVLIAIQNKYADAVSQNVEPYGVLVVGKPIVKAFFNQAVKFMQITRNRVQSLRQKNLNLQLQLEEMKIISRAKCVLIQYLSMTETQAHRYIEKQSMDLRLSKFHVAKQILKAYEQESPNQ